MSRVVAFQRTAASRTARNSSLCSIVQTVHALLHTGAYRVEAGPEL